MILERQDLTKSEGKVKSSLPKYWEKEKLKRKIQAVRNHEHKMLYTTLWMTGCRITEVLNIRKKDIDFEKYVMTIRWQKNRRYEERNIPIRPELKDLLQLFSATMKSEDKLFPISRQRAWQIVKKDFNGHPHQFRHSFAVNWLFCGGDIYLLSRMLGHGRIQTTIEYLKIVPTDTGKELLKIEF
jgi:integrase/recombinase XerD